MNLICKMFGHQKMPPGWYGDIEYGTVEGGHVDGVGRIHGVVKHECWRCRKTYIVSRLHIDQAGILKALKAEGRTAT